MKSQGQFKSVILAHGKDIAGLRHRAVYQNQTYDVFSYTMLLQGRKVDKFTNASRQFVKTFALAMAKWNAEMLRDIWSHIRRMTPGPRRGLDWPELLCSYIPFRIALAEVRLEKIHTKKEIVSIQNVISDIITDILASLNMRKFWDIDNRPINLI